MPEISVVIPVYNAEKYLASCLDSVLAQSYEDFEVICVNDGATDNSWQVLDEYQEKDNRIRVINQQNQGPAVARDKGVAEAKGKYIYFMDADDIIHPELLEITSDFAERFGADLVSFGLKEFHKDTHSFTLINKDKIKYKKSDNPIFLGTTKEKYKINYGMGTKLYKKELLNGIKFLTNNRFEDFPHTFAVLAKKPRTVVLNKALYFYRIEENSRSHRQGTVQQIKNYQEGINYIYDIYNKPEFQKELAFLKRTFIPNILKHQLGRCRRADISVRPQMYAAFAKELQELDNRGLISWRGHKLSRYLVYRRLLNEINFKKHFLYYYTSEPNFGDKLNENLMDFFKIKYKAKPYRKSNFMCIGSLLRTFPKEAKDKFTNTFMRVFGSGFICAPDIEDELFGRPMVFHALRGEISKKRCEKITGEDLSGVALGDPGLLIKRIFPKIQRQELYDVGFVCHYVDRNAPELQNLKFSKLSVKFIDILGDPEKFVREMAECKFILSSAMHGLICADSLGIPNKHVIMSDRVGTYKFHDYYSVFKNFTYAPVYLKDRIITDEDIDKFAAEYTITQEEVESICDNLERAFPKF